MNQFAPCAGDCLAKGWRETGSLFKIGTKRCTVNTGIMKYILLRYFKGRPIRMPGYDIAREVELV